MARSLYANLFRRYGSPKSRAARRPGEFDLSVYAGGAYVQPEAHHKHGLAELYPGYAPSHTRFVDWPRRPYVLTGYSVPAPGQVTTI